MKTYVIGAKGFIGKNLSEWFQNHGQVKVAQSYCNLDSIGWQTGVLADLKSFAPDVVLMPGASQSMQDDDKAIHELIESNCKFPCLVAQCLLDNFPDSKLVTFGSSWQYADSDEYRPFNLYAASKQAGQDLLVHYALRGLKVLQLIMFDSYSETDKRRKLLNLIKDACIKGEVIGTTEGDQEIDLVHINDICKGVERALDELQEWDTSQGMLIRGLGSGCPITIKELLYRVAKIYGKPVYATIGERPYRPREVMKVYRKYTRPSGWKTTRIEFQGMRDAKTESGNN